ncbi:MAG: PHP domain-containing protein, partial [Actinomycetota bacterium]|nr:PHP domain-containing protein [Actinomycetota bacterium]
MMVDLHLHTSRCGHAEGEMSEYVDTARRAGLDVIAFTDHLPLPSHLNPDGSYAMKAEELAAYVADVREMAARVDRPRVLLGIEADWLPEWRADTVRVLSAHPFDVVLGSVHFLDGWVFDDPDLLGEWEGRDVLAVWERYFATLAEAAGSGLFDVMAHVDLIKKFGHRPDVAPDGLYADLAAALADAQVAVEVSSAGLR